MNLKSTIISGVKDLIDAVESTRAARTPRKRLSARLEESGIDPLIIEDIKKLEAALLSVLSTPKSKHIEWVNCPVCGESDMMQETSVDDPTDKIIQCTNTNCASNGGTCADALQAKEQEPRVSFKPCPFCGAEPRFLEGKAGYWTERVICDSCHFHLPVEQWESREAPQKQASPPPHNCRQRLMMQGKPYAKSSCSACGDLSPKWAECNAALKIESKTS